MNSNQAVEEIALLAMQGKWIELEALLDNVPGLATVRDEYGVTALMTVARFGAGTQTIAKLIALGADVNDADQTGTTAMGLAISHEDRFGISTDANIHELIHGGADLTAAAQNGQPPLHWAVYERNAGATRIFLSSSIAVSARNLYGQTIDEFAEEIGATGWLSRLR